MSQLNTGRRLGRALGWFSLGVGMRQTRIRGAVAAVALIGLMDLFVIERLGRRGASKAIHAKATTTVNCPVQKAYISWRHLEQLPQFMYHLQSVRQLPAARRGAGGREQWHWVARGPAGKAVEWDAEIVEDRPGELLSWRSVGRGDVATTGSVRFAPAPKDRGTEIIVELAYTPPGGRAGAAVARLFGEEPNQQIRDDLRRFKQVVETGEVVRSDAAPEGFVTKRQRKQRAGRPAS